MAWADDRAVAPCYVALLAVPGRRARRRAAAALTAAGVLARVAGERHVEYELTGKGAALWPVVLSLMGWGDDFYAPRGPRRLYRHAADGGQVDRSGRCDACGLPVPPAGIIIEPGPGLEPTPDDDSWVTAALTRPHRLLEPLRPTDAPAVP